jgi:hypothetical protein
MPSEQQTVQPPHFFQFPPVPEGEPSTNGSAPDSLPSDVENFTSDDAELIAAILADFQAVKESAKRLRRAGAKADGAKYRRFWEAGRKLAVLRSRHDGDWEKWVRANCKIGPRQARRHIEYGAKPESILSDLKTAKAEWNKTNNNDKRKKARCPHCGAVMKGAPPAPPDAEARSYPLAGPLVAKLEWLAGMRGLDPDELLAQLIGLHHRTEQHRVWEEQDAVEQAEQEQAWRAYEQEQAEREAVIYG